MNWKQVAWLIIAGLFVLSAGLFTVGQTAAQTQGTENLLVNPGFESGHHKQDGIAEITVPDGWRLHWIDGAEFFGSDSPGARPESVVWFIGDAPPDEQTLFFRDGSFALKVFKGGRPMYSALSQDVNGLQVGRRYRLVAPVYVDIVASYGSGGKQAPGDLESGLVRLGAGPVGAAWLDEGAIQYSGFWTAATVSPFYLSYPVFVFDFTATHESMTVWVEFGSRDTYPNNGFFLDTIGLYTLDEVDPTVGSNPAPANPNPPAVAGPPPTPFPTPTPRADGAIIHVVQAGDTFWTIAIQYAPALGLTPEETLPLIRELNGDPTFINVGQEILIAEPDESAQTIAAVTEPQEEEPAEVIGGGEDAPEEPVAEEEAAPEEPTPVPQPVAESAPAEPEAAAEDDNAICVSVFDDQNGDGLPDASESLLADAVFTISRPSGTVASYVSDGINEPYCFEDLEADTYQIAFSQPPGYKLTTAGNWAIALSDGASVPVQFGAQVDETAATDVVAEPVAEAASVETTDAATAATVESGDFAPRVGTIALAVAVALVLLAGVGVMLLRRG